MKTKVFSEWNILAFCVFVLPMFLAIWFVPWFVVGDGPSHGYNAYVMDEFIKGKATFQDIYILNWMPLPNLAEHWLLVFLMQVVTPRAADRILMTLTSPGLAASVLWLRWRVASREALRLWVF